MIDSMKVMTDIEENQKNLEGKDVISKIFVIKKKIEETPVNEWKMDSLVDYVFTLCKIMDNLSDLKDYAYIQSEALAEEYKSSVRDAYLGIKKSGEKVTDKMAEAQAEISCDEIKERGLKAEHQARWLRSLYDDMDRLINFTQTKAKVMVDSKIRTNIPNN
jgi:hypothetical protein